MRSAERRTMRDLRRGNRAELLRSLYFAGPTSRHDLAGVTGLSPATVSNVTAELLADGVVVEAGQAGSDGGRPRILLRVNPDFGHVIGVDVGETKVRVELFDLAMTRRAKAEYGLTPDHHEPARVVRHIRSGVDVVLRTSGLSAEQVLGIGVGVPGLVQPGPNGAVIHARAFGWDAVPFEAMLRKGTSMATFIDNGAKTSGLSELWFGAAKGLRHAVITLIGSGVGASIVTDGHPYRGATGSGGEWGHTTVASNGRRCRCGALGCLEAYVGAAGILARYRDLGGTTTTTDEEAALAEVLDSAETSRAATTVLADTVEYLGAGLADLINLLDPERIVIGGWCGLALGRRYLPAIRAAAESRALVRPFTRTSIELGLLGPDATALGAATLVVEQFLRSTNRPVRGEPTPA